MVSYQDSVDPSDFFRDPFMVFCASQSEPQYGVQTTMQYLEAFVPETLGARKAKNFWLKTRKFGSHNPAREEIRRRYPEETELLHRRLWIKHSINRAEACINASYNRVPRAALMGPPANFSNLRAYRQLEPNDRFGTYPSINDSHELRFFLNVSAEDAERSFTLSGDDLQYIQDHYPDKVGRLRELLWQRHLSLTEVRAEEAEVGRAFSQSCQEKEERIIKIVVSIATTISVIAAAIFSTIAITLCLSWLFIPASIFVCTSIGAPVTYFLTRN